MEESQRRLGRDVFIALAAIGWADGNLDGEEADAIVRAALEEGLELDEITEIEAATKAPVDIGVIDRSNLTKEDRLFVYAVAAWMTRLDGVVSEEELVALDKLGAALKVPPGPREAAARIAHELAEQSGESTPSRYDLPGLRKVIAKKLEQSASRRGAGSDSPASS
jgi:uncharacterized membrane protein YebE (DUF533 family)